jgi:diaminopimelate epimerase
VLVRGAVAAMVNDKADRDVRVLMEGGEVRIKWRRTGSCDHRNG